MFVKNKSSENFTEILRKLRKNTRALPPLYTEAKQKEGGVPPSFDGYFFFFLDRVFGLCPSSETAFASSSVSGTSTAYPVLSFAEATESVKNPSFGSALPTFSALTF